jgi:hypothetical protein
MGLLMWIFIGGIVGSIIGTAKARPLGGWSYG